MIDVSCPHGLGIGHLLMDILMIVPAAWLAIRAFLKRRRTR